MGKNYDIIEATAVAKHVTAQAAELKGWRLTAHGRRFREIARNLVKERGYIICTPAQLVDFYPEFVPGWYKTGPDCDKDFVWGIKASPHVANIHMYTLAFLPYSL